MSQLSHHVSNLVPLALTNYRTRLDEKRHVMPMYDQDVKLIRLDIQKFCIIPAMKTKQRDKMTFKRM